MIIKKHLFKLFSANQNKSINIVNNNNIMLMKRGFTMKINLKALNSVIDYLTVNCKLPDIEVTQETKDFIIDLFQPKAILISDVFTADIGCDTEEIQSALAILNQVNLIKFIQNSEGRIHKVSFSTQGYAMLFNRFKY